MQDACTCTRAIYKTTDVYLHYTLYSIHIYIGSEITLSLLNILYTLYRQLINIIYWLVSYKDLFLYMTPVSFCFLWWGGVKMLLFATGLLVLIPREHDKKIG